MLKLMLVHSQQIHDLILIIVYSWNCENRKNCKEKSGLWEIHLEWQDTTTLRRLQLVQNAAARLLTNTCKREHITPILSSLHWLPVSFRVDFKILLFVFKALNGLAPPYITEMLTLRQSNRALRSTNQLLLEVPRTRYRLWGDRAFSVAGPSLWNKLPADIRTITDLGLFKAKLKTYLFRLAFNL